MGGYFTRQSRSELIAELIKPQETGHACAQTLAHTLCGSVTAPA